jgi:hypothetical protein
LFVVAAVVFTVIKEQRAARRCKDAVVAEVTRRITTLDPDAVAPRAEPAPPPPDPTKWVRACGKVNELKRKMCRRCWAQRPANAGPPSSST